MQIEEFCAKPQYFSDRSILQYPKGKRVHEDESGSVSIKEASHQKHPCAANIFAVDTGWQHSAKGHLKLTIDVAWTKDVAGQEAH